MYAIIFRSDAFDKPYPDPKSGVDPSTLVWGGDCAALLIERLVERGIEVPDGNALRGEGGWTFFVRYMNVGFVLFLHWAALGDELADYWVIQVHARRTLLGLLTCRNVQREAAEKFSVVLADTVGELPAATDVKCLRWDEFRRLY